MVNTLRIRTISGSASILLDTLRVVAALTVLIFHATLQWPGAAPGAHENLSKLSHAAVMMFFVLSGYVIAFSTTKNNRGPKQYAVARLSRLYSVVLPALLLTAVVEVVVSHFDATLAAYYVRDKAWLRYALSALFCNEVGFWSAAPAVNTPLWSLSYEFWYYVLFGCWFYCGFNKKLLFLLLGISLLAGPKILLLMPVWVFGVLAYRLPRPTLPTGIAWVLVGLFMIVAGSVALYVPVLPYELGYKPLFFSNQFLTDWVVGLLFSLAMWLLPEDGQTLKGAGVKLLRTCGDLSFPLYVFHYPLFILWRVIFGWQADNAAQMSVAIAVVIVTTILLGLLVEKGRYRWAHFFAGVIEFGGTWRRDVGRKPLS
jgi:peptidoglycan/LPS O-acetylase OafA/YrhL